MTTEGTLWMGDLESWICESFIIDAFQKFGFKPKYVKLITDKRINKFRNFCLVTFNNLEEAISALFMLNAKKIPKTNMFFKLNLTKKYQKIKNNVYVGNLPRNINDSEFFNFFKSKYPSVYYASIITDNGLSRGYGFVHFSDEKEYQKCLKEMDGITFGSKTINVKEKKPDVLNRYNCDTINLFPSINNYLNFFNNQPKKIEKEISPINICISSNIKEKQKIFFPKIVLRNNSFSENLELLKKGYNKILEAKIQESIDKNFDNQFKKNQNFSQISKALSYYCSYWKQKNNN